MRIAIDALYLAARGQNGFSVYTSRIVERLAAGGDEVVLYTPTVAALPLGAIAELEGVRVREVEFDATGFPDRTSRDLAWYPKALSEALEADRPDVCFGPSQFLPVEWSGPNVVTIHDLIFERHPEFFTPANLALYTTWSRRAAEHADAIVTVSEASATDVREIWGIDDKPVVATPLASGLAFTPDDPAASRQIVAARLGVDRPYVLNVASGHPRKNLRGCVLAFAALPERVRRETTLVLVDLDSGWVHEMVRESGVAEQAVITDHLPGDLVPHVYAAAAALVHPSYIEGFGLPVLEAMSCGTPVVSSTRQAIPEVAGDAALLVDPTDTDAISDATLSVLTDPDLAARLSAAGLARSRGFDWARTAELTRDVLAGVHRAMS